MSPEQGVHYFLRSKSGSLAMSIAMRQLRQMARRQRADSTTPLSELCPANEVAVAMEFGPEAEFLVNATGLSGDGHTDCG
jgi:hypothetical protein